MIMETMTTGKVFFTNKFFRLYIAMAKAMTEGPQEIQQVITGSTVGPMQGSNLYAASTFLKVLPVVNSGQLHQPPSQGSTYNKWMYKLCEGRRQEKAQT
jgi:hypothetical protein